MYLYPYCFSFITYIANNWGMETIDPDICISDRDRRVALIISSLFGTAGKMYVMYAFKFIYTNSVILGANRFYLGYPISACIKSVLERAFNVWWIVDLVRLWMGVFYDANGCILK